MFYETPITDQPLREDLYKKMMSADPVAALLPYEIVTKIVSIDGWNRFVGHAKHSGTHHLNLYASSANLSDCTTEYLKDLISA